MNHASIPSKEANRDDDLRVVVDQEAPLDQLGLRKLLFIEQISTPRLPSSLIFLGSIFHGRQKITGREQTKTLKT